MLSLYTNASTLNTQNALGSTKSALTTSMTRLGTGQRVNSAMDDAAGLQIATRLDAQTRGMAVASRNTQNSISLMQTAEGALGEVSNILLRMKDLATQSADVANSTADRNSMQSEFDQLGSELTNIMKNTSFGGDTLFGDSSAIDGTTGKLGTAALQFQIGASKDETMTLDLTGATGAMQTLGTKLTSVSSFYNLTAPAAAGTEIATQSSANTNIKTISDALDSVGTLRASLGAAANRLDHVFNNLQNMSTNTTQAKGRIMDTDYSTETANMTTKQMLMQAGTSMLKQSNAMNQMVLALMQ
jgi:flagellin